MLAIRQYGLLGGLLFFFIASQLPAPEGLDQQGWLVLVIALWMALWWMTEAVPMAVTALIPLVAFPLLDLGSLKSVGSSYAGKAIFLTLGGFIIGIALQRWNLHIRIAMQTVKRVGTEPRRVIGGFMIACAFLSMWMTNTATTVMMLPIAYSVALLLSNEGKGDDAVKKRFGTALMLGLAYSASIGGMMTLVGTSTNVMFKGYFEENYGIEIDFLDWMKVAVPIGVTLLFITWWLLTRIMFPCKMEAHDGIAKIINQKLADLGKMSVGEKRTLFVFVLTASLWVGKDWLEPYLGGLKLNDASIAIFGALLLFIIPADWKSGTFLLEWKDTRDVPWGILLLLGGGLALAGAMNSFGVADWIGGKITSFSDLPIWVLILLTVTLIIFLSELMSNVATLTAFLPVIVAVAIGFGENPLLLAVPAALAASCAFMLPVATPPNAIVFGSNLLTIPQMAKTGIWLNIIGIFLLCAVSYVLGTVVFDVELGVLPEWAMPIDYN
ncbi:MAG: DASS family sodium-coupled anion symporter [Rickettsiales bacterium]|nr:DASS family sodium-coupled anion symporter [Rickettsiales bacterium]